MLFCLPGNSIMYFSMYFVNIHKKERIISQHFPYDHCVFHVYGSTFEFLCVESSQPSKAGQTMPCQHHRLSSAAHLCIIISMHKHSTTWKWLFQQKLCKKKLFQRKFNLHIHYCSFLFINFNIHVWNYLKEISQRTTNSNLHRTIAMQQSNNLLNTKLWQRPGQGRAGKGKIITNFIKYI